MGKHWNFIREIKDDEEYTPSEEYQNTKPNKLTNVVIDAEYERFQTYKANILIGFEVFVDSKRQSYTINNPTNTTIERAFLTAGQSDDKFMAEITYRVISSNEIKEKTITIVRGNELKTIEAMTTDKDYDHIISDLTEIIKITIIRLKKPKRKKNQGAFFPYYNTNKDIDLERYQIFPKYKKGNYDVNCLINCFRHVLSDIQVNELKLTVKSQHVPLTKIKEIAEIMKIKIHLRLKVNDRWEIRKYGKVGEIYKICLLEEHYFIDEEVDYTKYSIKNYKELKKARGENWHKYYEKNKIDKTGKKKISSHILIDLMLKNDMFKKIPLEDMAKTQFLGNYQPKEPKALDSGSMKTVQYEKKYTTLCKSWDFKNKKSYFRKYTAKDETKGRIQWDRNYVYADFETTTQGNKHIPFMCSYIDTEESKGCFTGRDSGIQFLDALKDHSVVYFHNSGYDLNFIYEHTTAKCIIKNGSFVYLYTCIYKGKQLEFRDSYMMISSKLSGFPKMFGMKNIQKEIMPYGLYDDDFDKPCLLKDVKPHIDPKDWREFLVISKPYVSGGQFDKLSYARFYCDRDVEILYKGFTKFRENALSEFDIDPLAYLTISSVANAYLTMKGCFKDVYKLGGARRAFIQKSVRGGRCMTRRNERFTVEEHILNDFDGVSLYPSAMFLMDGFIKGTPNVWNPKSNIDIIKQDQYFIKIKITKVNKKLDFPLIAIVEDGILQYKNECTTMYVDRYTLEDLIEFQGIEYKIIEGYYFNEGFNTTIKTTIEHMFNQRLKYKKEKNPIQVIYKLIMNSSYGKTIMKEHLTEDVIINEDKYNDYVYRNHNFIKNIIKTGRQYWITKTKSINKHESFPHIGSSILSFSKRIMNRVFGVLHDNDIIAYYQDTDSIHMNDKDVKKLEALYNVKYKGIAPPLVGKHLGQFHCDFDLAGSVSDPVSLMAIFLGKKTYIDVLKGVDKDGKTITGQHIRFKGIPSECIKAVAQRDYKGDCYALYKDMLQNKKKITFDLCKGIDRKRPVFENRNGTVRTLDTFERAVQFN